MSGASGTHRGPRRCLPLVLLGRAWRTKTVPRAGLTSDSPPDCGGRKAPSAGPSLPSERRPLPKSHVLGQTARRAAEQSRFVLSLELR